MTTMLKEPAYLHGTPQSSGILRSQMSDFKVFEQLPFTPCGEGEHLYSFILEKQVPTHYLSQGN